MTTHKPVSARPANARFAHDRPRADGRTDADVGVPAADFRKGLTNTDTDEWLVPKGLTCVPTSLDRDEDEADSGDDTVDRTI